MGYEPYQPQNTPTPAGERIWTIEGPILPYRIGPFTIPCPTRSTVLAGPSGDLWIHSPIRFSPDLLQAIRRLGPVRGLIAPNTFHHLHLAQWAEALPQATCLAAPRLETKLKSVDPARLAPARGHHQLTDWLDVELIEGGAWAELVFHHRASRTLVVTDLFQNFELDRASGWGSRSLLFLSGAGRGPVVSTEMLAMAFFAGRLSSVRTSLKGLSRFEAERLLLAHGAQPTQDQARRLGVIF